MSGILLSLRWNLSDLFFSYSFDNQLTDVTCKILWGKLCIFQVGLQARDSKNQTPKVEKLSPLCDMILLKREMWFHF